MRDFLRKTLALWCLRLVRPYFIDRSIGQYVKLTDYGFHEAYENNPQIIFRCKHKGFKFGAFILPQACGFLSRFLEKGYAKNLSIRSLRQVGMAEPLLDCPEMLLMPRRTCGYNDLKNYDINSDARKTEGKIVVYSVLTGAYDNIKDPLYVTPEVDYVLFTNSEVKTKVWKVVKVSNDGISDMLLSRRIKMLPHEYLDDHYDINIYVDANVFIFGDITMLSTRLNDLCSFAVTTHSVRNSVSAEMQELVQLGKVDAKLAQSVLERYFEEGFNDDLGLAECTVLVRKHKDEQVKRLMNAWWNEFVGNRVNRDQISLMYCIWKMHFGDYELVEGHVMNNQYCITRRHNK